MTAATKNSPIKLQDFPDPAAISSYLSTLTTTLQALSIADIATCIHYLYNAFDGGKQVFIMGNGGSAASADHLACDLAKSTLGKKFNSVTQRFNATSLTTNMALLTAWANDVGYDVVFAEQLRNCAQGGDLLIAISASGNSPNILEGIRAGQSLGMRTVGLLGCEGGAARAMLDHAIVVDSTDYGHIEDAHMMIGHLITAQFKEHLLQLAEEEQAYAKGTPEPAPEFATSL